jgi:hypothetical protein
MPADQRAVRGWLKQLGALTAAAIDGDEAEVRLRVLAPALAEEFPTAAFTPDSARAVARGCAKGFPTFGEACDALSAWWRDNRDRVTRLAIASDDPFDDATSAEDQALIRNWQRHASGDWGNSSGSVRRLAYELGYYRQYRPSVFARLVTGDERAQRIARANGWSQPTAKPDDVGASWRGISAEQVKAKIRTLSDHPLRARLGRILALAIQKHARQHVDLLPPEWLPEPTHANDDRPGKERAP